MSKSRKSKTPGREVTQTQKFEWKKRESGGPRSKTEDLGFTKSSYKKSAPKTEKLVEEHKEFREEIRKSR